MAVITMPEQPKARTYDKSVAEKVLKRALEQHSTAKAAAGAINTESGKRFRANDQDAFNLRQDRYINSRDYAERAKDGRWVVVIDNADKL